MGHKSAYDPYSWTPPSEVLIQWSVRGPENLHLHRFCCSVDHIFMSIDIGHRSQAYAQRCQPSTESEPYVRQQGGVAAVANQEVNILKGQLLLTTRQLLPCKNAGKYCQIFKCFKKKPMLARENHKMAKNIIQAKYIHLLIKKGVCVWQAREVNIFYFCCNFSVFLSVS